MSWKITTGKRFLCISVSVNLYREVGMSHPSDCHGNYCHIKPTNKMYK